MRRMRGIYLLMGLLLASCATTSPEFYIPELQPTMLPAVQGSPDISPENPVDLYEFPITPESAENLEEVAFLDTEDTVLSLAISPDGTQLVTGYTSEHGYAKAVEVWSLTDTTEPLPLGGHDLTIHSLAFSPDGSVLASAGGTYDPGGELKGRVWLWDMSTEELLWSADQETIVWSTAFSPDGTQLAVACGHPSFGPGYMTLYDVASGDALVEFSAGDAVSCCDMFTPFDVAFSPDAKTLATVNADGSVWLWEADSGEAIKKLGTHTAGVSSVAFNHDGTLLASAGLWSGCSIGKPCSPDDMKGEIYLWDVESGERQAVIHAHVGGVWDIAFSPDGQMLATTAYDDNFVNLWDAETGESLMTLTMPSDGVSNIAFSGDGTLLAAAGVDGSLCVWGVPENQ